MTTAHALLILAALPAAIVTAAYVPPAPRLAHAPSARETAEAINHAPPGATVTAPASLLRAGATNATERAIVDALAAVLADTRANMPEAARLTELQLAALYLAQMSKPVAPLAAIAPSNTVEYLIGAGMREDIARLIAAQPD